MATGLRIRNAATGQLQIASGYRNLHLESSGVMDTNTFIGGGDIRSTRTPRGYLGTTLGNDRLHVIRFVTSAVNGASGFGFVQYNNTFNVLVAENSPSKSLEYYTFGANAPEPSGPVGLRLRDEAGQVYYDSRRMPLRVLASVDMPLATLDPQHLGQFAPGTRIGLALSNPRYYYQSPYPEICYMFTDFLSLDASNNVYLTVGSVWYRNEPSLFTVGNTAMANQDARLLVIDLSEVPLGFGA